MRRFLICFLVSLMLCFAAIFTMACDDDTPPNTPPNNTPPIIEDDKTMTISNMRVSDTIDGLGIEGNPIFSYVINSENFADSQKYYQLKISSTYENSVKHVADIYDSKKVLSNNTTEIVYNGDTLLPKTAYYWRVVSWNTKGEKITSEPKRFVTANNDWAGEFIGKRISAPQLDLINANWIWLSDGGSGPAATKAETQYFRKSFSLDMQRLEKAYIAFTADDSCRVYFNNEAVADVTSWYNGIYTDITSLCSSNNTIAIDATNADGGFAGLVAKILIKYSDSEVIIATDPTWKVSKNLEDNWQSVDFNDSNWANPNQSAAYSSAPWGTGVSLEDTSARAAIMLRKEFNITKPVKDAIAYVCGLGYFEFSINGQLADDSVMNPYATQFDKTVLYRTFDIKPLITNGSNAVGVELGNGYYNEIGGVWNWQNAAWRDNPKALVNIVINYTDGTSQTIATDTTWKMTNDGAIRTNSLYYGDTFDARMEKIGFNTIGYNDSGWQNAQSMESPTGVLRSHTKAPYKKVKEFSPKTITKIGELSYVVDFGDMLSGWAKITNINEASGKKVTMTYGQALNEDGSVIKWGGADGKTAHWWPHAYIQQDNYICKGAPNESYEPKFSVKGHRYLQLDGLTSEPKASDIVSYRISNGVENIGQFESSDEMVNSLHQIMRSAMANNHLGENCDPVLEKTGWLGDINVSLDSLMYSYDMARALPEYIRVMQDCFELYGYVPVMTPTADWLLDGNSPVWNSVFVYGIKALESYFGKKEYASEMYDMLLDYTQVMIDEIKTYNYTWKDNSLGDWVAPVGGSDPDVPYNENVSEGSGIVGTAYIYGVLDYMSTLAQTYEKDSDVEMLKGEMEKIYDAFNAKFYNAEKQIYETTAWSQVGTRGRYRQTSNLIPLAFGLVPNEYVKGVVDNLVADFVSKDYHLDTGCVGTKYVLPILTDYGYADVAYKVLKQDTYPSWGFWLTQDATSTWEMWESTTRSYDHYFLGTYDEFLFSHVAGVREIKDGYSTFIVKPEFWNEFSSVKASINTVRGLLKVEHKTEGNAKTTTITIPFGSSATIYMPISTSITINNSNLNDQIDGVLHHINADGYTQITVGSGTYVIKA